MDTHLHMYMYIVQCSYVHVQHVHVHIHVHVCDPHTVSSPYRFLDKMYSLSSSESLVQFTRNPRAYLLPPQPQIPCKVCVVGPPTSGKTALAQLVAQCYNAMVHVCSCTQYTCTYMYMYMYVHFECTHVHAVVLYTAVLMQY